MSTTAWFLSMTRHSTAYAVRQWGIIANGVAGVPMITFKQKTR